MKTNILNYTENSYIYGGKTTTTMKKLIILLMALTVLSIAEPVYAQTNRPRNEFSISYGPLSRSKIYTIVKNILGKELTKNYGSNNFGARSFEYFYRISDFISVGAIFCAYHAKEWYDTVFGLNEEDDYKAKDKQNDYCPSEVLTDDQMRNAVRNVWQDSTDAALELIGFRIGNQS